MADFTIFQCIPAYRPEAIIKVIRAISKYDCRILLDLEDSIQDTLNPENTPALKQQARLDLLQILSRLPDHCFDVRINALNSLEFTHDKILLRTIFKKINSVFIPKVESAETLESFAADFQYLKMNIITETTCGVSNLETILNCKVRNRIEHVFFGNYDYHLDSNQYPIQEQHSPGYWEMVAPIIKTTEQNGLRFGNSPYVYIDDMQTLKLIHAQLKSFCTGTFAVMSLHKKQTHFFSSLSTCSLPVFNLETAYQQIKLLPGDFIAKKLKGRSFAMTTTNRIIPPQEYLLMLSHS